MKWRQGISILSSGPLSEEGCRAMGKKEHGPKSVAEKSLGSVVIFEAANNIF